MGTPADRIAQARAFLVRAGISEADAALDAEVIARNILEWDRARLLTHGREPAPEGFAAKFEAAIQRRARREPVAQIIGHREFWNLDFEVTPDVLIPRPETELIVEEARDFAASRACRTIADIGTGSGCIAVSLAIEVPAAEVTATDRSAAALAVARRNAARHGVLNRIEFRETDLLDDLSGPYDLIVSNPPYVPDADRTTLQIEVRDFEPPVALYGGADGLAVTRRLLEQARSRLAQDGRLIVEFGLGQEAAVRQFAQQSGWRVIGVREDLQRIPRTAILSHA